MEETSSNTNLNLLSGGNVMDERIRNLIAQAPVAMCLYRESEYIIEIVNDRMLQIWGKPFESVINKSVFEAMPDAKGQGFEGLLHKVYHTGESFSANEISINLLRNGINERIYVNLLYEPFREIDGTISGIVEIANDITEQVLSRKKIEESEERFKLALIGSSQTVFSQDKNLKHTWIYNSHPDFKPEDIIGKSDEDLHTPDSAKILTDIKTKVLITGKPFDGDVEIEINGQSLTYTLHFEATRDTDSTITGITGTVIDITEKVKTQQKIRESEQEIRKIKEQLELSIEAGKIGIWFWDVKKDILTWSKEQHEIYGVSPLENINKSSQFHAFVLPEDRERILKETQIHSLTLDQEYDFRIIRKNDGQMRWIKSRARNILDEKGEVEFISGVNIDITEEREATEKIRESELQFNTLANNIQNLAWIADGEGWIYWYNKQWYNYTGTTLEEMQGWGWEKVHHPDHVDRVVDFVTKAWKINEPWELIFPLRGNNGVFRTFLTRAFPVCSEDGQITHWIGTNTDIEEQKRKEEKKDEFISIASHEMKTPLTTSKAYLQMLELALALDENNQEALMYAKKASQSINRLNELIGELLDVSKIRLGKLNYTITTFNFNEMVDNTIENIQLTSPTHTIIKSGKVLDKVMGDRNRLQQVVTNLLTNAIKYSPHAKQVSVTVEQENNQVKVSVKDVGIGMSKENLTKIFEKYHRIEEDAIHFQGLGIGLFFSYEIVQRHHGKLWAESEIGKGSTFYFTLPINQTALK